MEAKDTASTIPELFYDVLSILMPGSYLLIALFFVSKKVTRELATEGVLHPTVTILILAYLLGYLLYSVSSFIVAIPFKWVFGQPMRFLLIGDEVGKKYLGRHQRLFLGVPATPESLRGGVERGLRHIRDTPDFSVTAENYAEVYEFCRNYVMEHSARRAVSIRKEQAYGEMSRALVLISVTLPLLLLGLRLLLGYRAPGFRTQMAVHGVFLLSFAFRYAQARLINPYHIYATFCIMMVHRAKPTQAT